MAHRFDSRQPAAHLPAIAQAVGGRFEDALDQLAGHNDVPLALLGRNIFYTVHALAQQPFAATGVSVLFAGGGFPRHPERERREGRAWNAAEGAAVLTV